MILLLVVFCALFLYSGYKLIAIQRIYQKGLDTYDAIAEAAYSDPQPATEPAAQQPEQQTDISIPEVKEDDVEEQLKDYVPLPPYEPLLNVNFDKLLSMNPDTVGWINMEGGQLDYPIVRGPDNDYYLRRLFDGTYNWNGSIFMDYRNAPDFSDRNTFIYGHNMGNGTMFAVLLNYSTPGFYEQNPELILVTPDASYYLRPFSGYVTTANAGAYRMEFEDDESFSTYLETIIGWSEFVSDVEVTEKDRIVTLSTCSYLFNNARYVLHCKLDLVGKK